MNATDIVVYDGIISTAGLFWGLGIGVADCTTVLRKATKEEVDLYNKRPES